MTLESPQPIGIGAFPDALRLVASAPEDEPAVGRYHRWLLDPESESPAAVRVGLGRYAPLVDLVAFTVGLTDLQPSAPADAPAELRALVLSARASAALEVGDAETAGGLLEEAAAVAEPASPTLAGSLLGNAGTLLQQAGHPDAAAVLTRALDLLRDADQPVLRAELHHALGSIAHEAALAADDSLAAEMLRRAMHHYYSGLQLVTEASAPLAWAGLQLDLAAAQLAIPMREATDQLRIGIAAQSLRACRRVFTAAEHPGPWSSATLDLANALVYLPSTKQGDNLVEAVELYEEILASGIREDDPAGKARLLANQGNALAHLGIFDQAKARLVEARFLFESVLDHDGAMVVRGVLDEIARAQVEDPDNGLADLAHRAEQMSRMPAEGMGLTSGMGVRIARPGIPEEAQQRAKVTVLARRTSEES